MTATKAYITERGTKVGLQILQEWLHQLPGLSPAQHCPLILSGWESMVLDRSCPRHTMAGEGPRHSFCFIVQLCLRPQAPSEYETSPEQLFYRIAHLNRGQQYLLWVAAVTSAGRGNSSEKVTIEPAGKGEKPVPGV